MAKDSKSSYEQKKWASAVAEHARMKQILKRAPAASSFRSYAQARIKDLELAYSGRLN